MASTPELARRIRATNQGKYGDTTKHKERQERRSAAFPMYLEQGFLSAGSTMMKMNSAANNETICPGCGLIMPKSDRATGHEYINESPEDWSVYTEGREEAYSNALHIATCQ